MLYNLETYSVLVSSFQSWSSKCQRKFSGSKRKIQKTIQRIVEVTAALGRHLCPCWHCE